MFTEAPEITTAITDFILGLFSLYFGIRLHACSTGAKKLRMLWIAIMYLLAVVSIYGAILHGVVIPAKTLERAWIPLSMMLGFMPTLMVVALMYQWKGTCGLKYSAMIMGSLQLIFSIILVYVAFWITPDYFIVFIVFSGLAMIAALIIALLLARGNTSARYFSISILLMIFASISQAVLKIIGFNVTIGYSFDHNTIYHVVMMLALVVAYQGVRIMDIE